MQSDGLAEAFMNLVQDFGLLANDKTPCGEGLSLSEAHALSLLHRDQPLTQKEIARRLRLEKSTVSRLVDRLEQNNWITRQCKSEDRRLKKIQLTPSGTNRARTLEEARRERFEALLNEIPSNKRQQVQEGLSIFLEALHATDDFPPGNAGS